MENGRYIMLDAKTKARRARPPYFLGGQIQSSELSPFHGACLLLVERIDAFCGRSCGVELLNPLPPANPLLYIQVCQHRLS